MSVAGRVLRPVCLMVAAVLATMWLQAAWAGSASDPISAAGRDVSRVVVVSDNTAQTIENQTEWTDLAGAASTVGVPLNWTSALLVLRFSGADICNSANCLVRILVDGVEANPVMDRSSVFDGPAGVISSHSIDRWITVGPGMHVVQVQWAQSGGGVTFTLTYWQLTVERARAS